MAFLESFEAKANCAMCERHRMKRNDRSQPVGWVCANQGLQNKTEIPLASVQPSVTVETVFGYIIAMTAVDANGKKFPCRFQPYQSTKIQVKVKPNGR